MKRQFLRVLALALLLLTCAALLPVSAAEHDWKKITYTLAPTAEGAAPVTGDLTTKAQIPGSCTLSFDSSKTYLTVNGQPVESGVLLETAGVYKVGLENLANRNQKLSYEVTVLPDINVANEQVFTTYPVITCSNAVKIEHQRNLDLAKPFEAGTQLRELGRHTLIVYGKDPAGYQIKFPYVFYIKACDAVRVKDTATGKEAIDVIVGTFDDMTVEATVDGDRALVPGSNIITEVGQHTLSVKLNGAVLNQPHTLPDTEEMALRIELYLDSLDSKEPYYLDLSGWDVQILMDGKPVSGMVEMNRHGTHVLTAQDKDGKPVEGAFLVQIGQDGVPTPMTNLKLTFHNPHLIYAIFVAVPALALLVLACYFFLARRRIV